MNILVNVLIDRGGAAVTTKTDMQMLRDRCYDYAHEAAASMNIYTSHALDNLYRYSGLEPDSGEVRQYLGDDQLGDWRAVMTQAAILATVGALEAQAEADLTKLEAAIHEAALVGYEPRKLYATCAAGWCPHDSESSWANGTLFQWTRLDGGEDAAMLRVGFSKGTEAWIDLRWID